MSQSSNVTLIQSFEDKFIEGDIDYILSILTDDVTVHQCASVPYPGDHRGKDAFLALSNAFNEVWGFSSALSTEIMPAGEEKVLVLADVQVTAKPTGQPVRLRISELYTIRDDKICDILIHYWDTHEMFKASGGAMVLRGAALET